MKLKKVQRNLKESVGQDLSEYQKWVDYDMEKYGRVSKDTFSKIRAAGLNVVRDQYGEYEVIAKRPIERNESTELKEDVNMSRKEMIDYLEKNWNTAENYKKLYSVLDRISVDAVDDSDEEEGFYANISTEDLKNAIKELGVEENNTVHSDINKIRDALESIGRVSDVDVEHSSYNAVFDVVVKNGHKFRVLLAEE